MQRITISGIETSSVGFGCTKLYHNTSMKGALSNLETAFDQGITHFDTARLYGLGAAEGILGKFLKDKRHQVTITTKFGLNPPNLPFPINLKALYIIRTGLNLFKDVKSKLGKSIQNGLGNSEFSEEQALKSIEKSLQELDTNYIDFLLLHEFPFLAANSKKAIAFLEKIKAQGKIRAYGIGTSISQIPSDINQLDKGYSLVQFESSLLNPYISRLTNLDSRSIVLHSIFKDYAFIQKALSDQSILKKSNKIIGYDLARAQGISRLLISTAKAFNPNGIILFTSKENNHIKENVQSFENHAIEAESIKKLRSILNNKTTKK